MGFIKRYLVAGLLVWLPLGVTVAALIFLINLFEIGRASCRERVFPVV